MNRAKILPSRRVFKVAGAKPSFSKPSLPKPRLPKAPLPKGPLTAMRERAVTGHRKRARRRIAHIAAVGAAFAVRRAVKTAIRAAQPL